MTLLLIHAGGTIGMGKTDKGYAPVAGVLQDGLAELQRTDVDVVEMSPLIDSANATPQDWNRIAEIIEQGFDRYDGFIVTHGTDTLAFTASALCFAFSGLTKPVIVTGSMIPLTQPNSDGLRNLGDALTAASTAPAGVWVQFAGKLLHGARVRKSHSSALDAFEAADEPTPPAINAPALTRTPFAAADLAILSMAPAVSEKVIDYVLRTCDGVVLRVFGSGTVPETDTLRRALAAAKDRGALVIAVSQCPEGRIAFGTYAAGAMLVEAEVVDGRDMTVEAAYAKLAHVIGWSEDTPTRRKRLATVLCGEASR
jgi:L-asparaginase